MVTKPTRSPSPRPPRRLGPDDRTVEAEVPDVTELLELVSEAPAELGLVDESTEEMPPWAVFRVAPVRRASA